MLISYIQLYVTRLLLGVITQTFNFLTEMEQTPQLNSLHIINNPTENVKTHLKEYNNLNFFPHLTSFPDYSELTAIEIEHRNCILKS